MKVKMKDVAKACKVSVSTVSLVLSHDERIPESTREKVLRTVKEMGYRPNILARNLARQKSQTIACVVPEISFLEESAFFAQVLKHIYETTSRYGFRIIFEMATPQFIHRKFSLRLFRERGVDALIFVSPSMKDTYLRELEDYKSNIILLCGTIDKSPFSAVVPDNIKGGYIATQYLLNLGHTKIGFISPSLESSWIRERKEGYLNAIKNSGLSTPDTLLMQESSYRHNLTMAIKMLIQAEVTAIFAASDLYALEVIKSLQIMNYKVPEDFSVVGMDDIPLSAVSHPQLTTVQIPLRSLAQCAVDRLISQLNKKASASENQFLVLPVELIERQSASSPKGKTR